MVIFHIHIVVKGLLQHAFWYLKYILARDAQEWTPSKLEFKLDVNRIRKDFFYAEVWNRISRINKNTLANSAMVRLYFSFTCSSWTIHTKVSFDHHLVLWNNDQAKWLYTCFIWVWYSVKINLLQHIKVCLHVG
jgi:hypothetical protein